MVTCHQQEKVSSYQNVLLWIFLQIRNLIWRYAELICLFVGSGLIPLNSKLQQEDRTFCCGHNTVGRVNPDIDPCELPPPQKFFGYTLMEGPLLIIFGSITGDELWVHHHRGSVGPPHVRKFVWPTRKWVNHHRKSWGHHHRWTFGLPP